MNRRHNVLANIIFLVPFAGRACNGMPDITHLPQTSSIHFVESRYRSLHCQQRIASFWPEYAPSIATQPGKYLFMSLDCTFISVGQNFLMVSCIRIAQNNICTWSECIHSSQSSDYMIKTSMRTNISCIIMFIGQVTLCVAFPPPKQDGNRSIRALNSRKVVLSNSIV